MGIFDKFFGKKDEGELKPSPESGQPLDLDELLGQISKPCTTFTAGGFRPSNEIEESWIGRVTRFLPDEEVPIDKHGKRMAEMGQFFLPALPHIPESLSGVTLLTAFISPELEGDSDLMEGCFEIREYREIEGLVQKDSSNAAQLLKPFPLIPIKNN